MGGWAVKIKVNKFYCTDPPPPIWQVPLWFTNCDDQDLWWVPRTTYVVLFLFCLSFFSIFYFHCCLVFHSSTHRSNWNASFLSSHCLKRCDFHLYCRLRFYSLYYCHLHQLTMLLWIIDNDASLSLCSTSSYNIIEQTCVYTRESESEWRMDEKKMAEKKSSEKFPFGLTICCSNDFCQ